MPGCIVSSIEQAETLADGSVAATMQATQNVPVPVPPTAVIVTARMFQACSFAETYSKELRWDCIKAIRSISKSIEMESTGGLRGLTALDGWESKNKTQNSAF